MTQSTSCPAAAPTFGLTLLLAAVTAIGPFSLQSLAPALPTLGRVFGTEEETTQLLISSSMWALALGAVIYGPLSDRYGRRPVLMGCMAFAAIGASVSMTAESFELVLAGRLIFAAGAGGGLVLARAVARDMFDLAMAATLIARIMAIMVVAPMVAPLIGGLLIDAFGWRALFAAVAIGAMLLLLMTGALLRESLSAPSESFKLRGVLEDFREIGVRRVFLANALFASASLASFFFFVGGAPYLMEEGYGYAPSEFGALFLISAVFYSAANFCAPMAARRFGVFWTLLGGAVFSALACVVTALVVLAGHDNAVVFMVGMTLNSIGAGLSISHAIAGAVDAAPEKAGAASGLTAVMQFFLAGVAAQAATFFPSDSSWPLLLAIGGAMLIGAAAYVSLASRPVKA